MIEKIIIINIIGKLSYLDDCMADILRMGVVEIISAQNEWEKNAFSFDLSKEINLEKVVDLSAINVFTKDADTTTGRIKAEELMNFMDIKTLDKKYFDELDHTLKFDFVYDELIKKAQMYSELKKELDEIAEYKEKYRLFSKLDVPLKDIRNLKNFKAMLGIVDRDGRLKIKGNYQNMPAIFMHVGSYQGNEAYMVAYPLETENDTERMLKSLHFTRLKLLDGEDDTPEEIVNHLEQREQKIKEALKDLEKYKENLREDEQVLRLLASMVMLDQVEEKKKLLLRSEKSFYLSGYIGEKDIDRVCKELKKYDDIDIRIEDPEDYDNLPTKLNNNKIIKPFETLVKMYGVPNYGEIDPTSFFSIGYLLLFGAMFGDFGQGLIFFLLGTLMLKKYGDFAKILQGMGISSMIFGIMYGSVFGIESLIPALWLRPFENINQTLKVAIYFGVVLLSFSFILGIITKFKRNEKIEAIFSKDGFSGFMVFIGMFNAGVVFMSKNGFFPMNISIIMIIAGIVMMLFKPEFGKIIFKEKIDTKGYYLEASFGLLEALMSIMSNIISFIRVGAFAINHVGLFLAFQTLGEMTGNTFGNIFSLVLGNIVIIGLEGLIVFIQSLRLEYYELFSKYYIGDGREFAPDKLEVLS